MLKMIDRLPVKRLHERAMLPTRGSSEAAGLDLYASEPLIIPSKGRGLAKTGIAIAVPRGHYGRVAPRSGLAVNFGIDVGAGVIDSDYRGEVGVVLFNFGDQDFAVNPGMRIAQLIIEKIEVPDVVEVADLNETVRGDGGFGSTGSN
ncbi:unnamed protein product [Blepharisma stoltei]|uniref:Deoxyuridine 5'-triphosphate nucleotidohydrolase n=1 Tax=Blepharisma stoltei TaxID=1481888 RepID=A0AAU9JLQ0_9CILI|nr:unnamed protein product [Blepharisma stoltei]